MDVKTNFDLQIRCGIKSLKSLYAELREEGFVYICTNRLGQDSLENFFSQLR